MNKEVAQLPLWPELALDMCIQCGRHTTPVGGAPGRTLCPRCWNIQQH